MLQEKQARGLLPYLSEGLKQTDEDRVCSYLA